MSRRHKRKSDKRHVPPLAYNKIKMLREAKNLSQEDAAVAAGMSSKQAWNRIECARSKDIKLSTLQAMARVLGVDVRELIEP